MSKGKRQKEKMPGLVKLLTFTAGVLRLALTIFPSINVGLCPFRLS